MGHDAARLEQTVETLCTAQGRMVGTSGHDAARRLLRRWCGELGLSPYGDDLELSYETSAMRGTNVVGVRKGEDPSLPPLLLAAHYDSVIAAPCADDNAAAVAILLSVAEALGEHRVRRDVVFAFFDAEEPPYFQSESMGSIRFVHDQMDGRGVSLAVVLDLMGHDVQVDALPLPFPVPGLKRLRDLFFVTGAESHTALQTVLREVALPRRLGLIATRNENVGDLSDHHAFRLAGHAYLFFSCGRWQHYHMPSDTPDKLSYGKMARMASYLEALVLSLVDTDFDREPDSPCEVDTVAFEKERLRASLGWRLPLLLRVTGLKRLESREDLDDLAARLQSLGI